MKKAVSKKSATKSTVKLVVKPVPSGWNGLSAALPTLEAVAAAYAPVKLRPRYKAVKQASHKVAAKVLHLVVSAEPAEQVEKAMAAAAKVAEKKLGPLTKSPLHKALQKALFKFVQAQQVEDTVAYGYVHKDQRAALLTTAANGTEAWQVRFTDGATSGGVKLDLFTSLLRVTTAKHDYAKKRAADKLDRVVAKSPIACDTLGAGAEGDDYKAPVRLVPEEVAGVPANVARAVEMLGTVTNRRYDVKSLGGDKNYGKRLSLLKKLFDRERVLVDETGIMKLVDAFHSAVGMGEGTKAQQVEEFVRRCADIDKKVRIAKAEAAKKEKALAEWKARQTVVARAVPGTILPGLDVRPSRAQRDATRADDLAYAKAVLSISPEQPAVPHPHAELVVVADDLRLLREPENGIVMLQMEKANSQGAIVVYNNSKRVAAGVVPLETLKALRVVTGVDPAEFAKQLLNPTVPSVPVTSVAARHLTAVINCCKEITMAKFEATKKLASSEVGKPVIKAAKAVKKAAKGEKAEEKTGTGGRTATALYRLVNESKAT